MLRDKELVQLRDRMLNVSPEEVRSMGASSSVREVIHACNFEEKPMFLFSLYNQEHAQLDSEAHEYEASASAGNRSEREDSADDQQMEYQAE